MKKSYFNNDQKTAKNIREIYEHTNNIKLTGSAKTKYKLKAITVPFSYMMLSLALNKAKSKLNKYEKEGKPLATATERYKHVDKILRRALGAKRVKYFEFGFDSLPKTPVLFVANHKSNIDGVLMMHIAIRHYEFPFLRVVAKKELADVKGIGHALKLTDTIFVDRSDIRSLSKVINEEVQAFQDDCSLLVFPEGTRIQGDSLGEFHSSALEVAFQTYVPIVPVCIFGTDNFLADKSINGSTKPTYNIAEVVVDALEPIKYSEYMHWTRVHLAEVLRDKIQKRYDLWKDNATFMYSSEFKKEEKKDPLKSYKELNEQQRKRTKSKIDN
ncbi:MAG: 1-acyl-sn-glycerol-3-phosphate acyltransferase [Mycoplasmataceae bacterium]|nr:1-acyl-sn-glycerol-3-phosphate acyltransferase [Mycoplasmataceae bacterium]